LFVLRSRHPSEASGACRKRRRGRLVYANGAAGHDVPSRAATLAGI